MLLRMLCFSNCYRKIIRSLALNCRGVPLHLACLAESICIQQILGIRGSFWLVKNKDLIKFWLNNWQLTINLIILKKKKEFLPLVEKYFKHLNTKVDSVVHKEFGWNTLMDQDLQWVDKLVIRWHTQLAVYVNLK